jgi:hypothetical protein
MRGIKNRLNQKWWFRSIRGYNWFSFRYWWFNYVIWAILIALLLWLLLKYTHQPPQCNRQSEITALLNSINRQLENCCNCNVPPTPPRDSTLNEIDRLRDSLNGKVGELTISLAWNTIDDLDLHLVEPGGFEIYYKNKVSPKGGKLDLDLNNSEVPLTRKAIENICYDANPPSGSYKVLVTNFKKNTSTAKIPATLQIKAGTFNKEIPLIIDNNGIKKTQAVHTFKFPIAE